jgi:GNAT superfamily N-acetyltransferase
MVEIQKAQRDDIPALLRLIEAYWQFENIDGYDSERLAPQIERLIDDPRLGTAWIGTVENHVVGYLIAVYVFSVEFMGMVAEFDEFFVHAEARGAGLGAKLIQAAEQECIRLGCTNISLQIDRDNEAARRFYYRHGFQERSNYELLDKTVSDA